jgi:PAS domain S-box-containing protein
VAEEDTLVKAGDDLSFGAIANSIDQMIWSTRPDGFHDYYNDRWYEYTGAAPGSTDGEGWNAMFHPEDQQRAWDVWRHSLKTGEPYHIEYRLRHKSGEYRWVIGRAQCVRNDEGQIRRWYGTCTDIHDLKSAQEQIRRNHDTFYDLIQNNPFGIYVIDADFRIAEASQGSQKVFENVQPLIGRDFAEVLRIVWAEPFASEAIERFQHTLCTGEPYSSPRTVQPRGDINAVEAYDWRIERIGLPDGREGVVCYFYDLSERQRWEAALGAASERIELALDAGAVAGTWVGKFPMIFSPATSVSPGHSVWILKNVDWAYRSLKRLLPYIPRTWRELRA